MNMSDKIILKPDYSDKDDIHNLVCSTTITPKPKQSITFRFKNLKKLIEKAKNEGAEDGDLLTITEWENWENKKCTGSYREIYLTK